jgi:hypothetical protein
MSYDISVWCLEPFRDPSALPNAGSWTVRESHWSIEGKGWILNSGPSDIVLPEDIPEDVVPVLPGIQHVVHLTLEPIDAPEAGFKALRKAAKTIAKASRGVVLDPQAGSVELPGGVNRYVPPKREKESRVAILEMSWWFEHASLLERAELENFLETLSTYLPEAMPRRYGLYEPPQHELEKTGRDHLLSFLTDHLTESVVWYATAPVAYVFISIGPDSGWQRVGAKTEFRCNRISIELDTAALDQPGWQTGLLRAWRALSKRLNPFYGDVRTLQGYFRSGTGFSSDGASEPEPTKSWWWKGIPQRLGHAVVLGEPYSQLWPEFCASAEVDGGLHFAATTDWRTDEDVTRIVGEVPGQLAIEFMPHQANAPGGGRWTVYPEIYPAIFPFKPA